MEGSEHTSAESGSAPPPVAAPPPARALPVGAIALLTAAVVFALGLYRYAKPIPGSESVEHRAVLAGLGVVFALAISWRHLRHRRAKAAGPSPRFRALGPDATPIRSATWATSLLLALTCVFAVFNYYRFDGKAIKSVEDHYDITYYYLNSKYFDELGYFDLYAAMLIADEDHRNRLDYIRVARDLHSYENAPRREILADRERVRARFSDARWESFKRESDFLIATKGKSELEYFFRDHGYNPPPTWNLIGSFFSNRVEIDQLKWITMVDFVLVFLMFVVILRTYGLEPMLLALLFMACTASGKWPVLGQALLRFDWLAALVVGGCMLKQGRHGIAGAAIAYSALSRVFPAIFFFPYLVLLVLGLVRRRTIDRGGRRFIAGAAIVSTLLIGGALAHTGVQSFRDAADNLALHQSEKSFSSLRVGLGDALIYRGERNWQHLRSRGGIPARAEQLGEIKPLLHGVGLAVLALIAFYMARRSPAIDAALPLAYFAFFALTTPQINYHNLRLMLVVWHAREPDRPRNIFGLICLFGTEIAAQYAAIDGSIPYASTSLSSIGLTFYFVGILASVLVESLAGERASGLATRLRAFATAHTLPIAIASGAALAGLLALYWRLGELPPPRQTFAIADIDEPKPPGTRWDADGNVIPDYTGIRIDLGVLSHARRVEVSFERDDSYELHYFAGDRQIGESKFARQGNERGGTLTQRRLSVPDEVREHGFDRLHILPMRGNDDFAIGHVRVLER